MAKEERVTIIEADIPPALENRYIAPIKRKSLAVVVQQQAKKKVASVVQKEVKEISKSANLMPSKTILEI